MADRRPQLSSEFRTRTAVRTGTGALDPEAAKVLRNTYGLLALTIAFSALTAGISMAIDMPYMGLWMLLPYFGMLFAVEKTKDSPWGLFWVFALTGFLGLTIGPILDAFIAMRGYQPIVMALGGTAAIFFATSGYVLSTKRDLSFMGSFLLIGLLVAFLAAIANFFLQITALAMTVSVLFIAISSGIIMWQTSAIVHGGERNYISATVTLFVMLYNIFLSLLQLLGIFGEE